MPAQCRSFTYIPPITKGDKSFTNGSIKYSFMKSITVKSFLVAILTLFPVLAGGKLSKFVTTANVPPVSKRKINIYIVPAPPIMVY